MKTSELIGPALDYSVAKAQGWTDYPTDSIEQGGKWHCDPEKTPFGRVMWKDHFTPSTDWSQAGTIIERERIKVFPNVGGTWSAQIRHTKSHPLVSHPVLAGWTNSSGPTPLIAAMRCYCCAKLGDIIDIPEELCQQPNN